MRLLYLFQCGAAGGGASPRTRRVRSAEPGVAPCCGSGDSIHTAKSPPEPSETACIALGAHSGFDDGDHHVSDSTVRSVHQTAGARRIDTESEMSPPHHKYVNAGSMTIAGCLYSRDFPVDDAGSGSDRAGNTPWRAGRAGPITVQILFSNPLRPFRSRPTWRSGRLGSIAAAAFAWSCSSETRSTCLRRHPSAADPSCRPAVCVPAASNLMRIPDHARPERAPPADLSRRPLYLTREFSRCPLITTPRGSHAVWPLALMDWPTSCGVPISSTGIPDNKKSAIAVRDNRGRLKKRFTGRHQIAQPETRPARAPGPFASNSWARTRGSSAVNASHASRESSHA